jgi:hypothetical protein
LQVMVAGADVGVGADMGVADVGEMIDLDAGFQARGLVSTKCRSCAPVAERGARPQPRIGADRRLLPIEACTIWENEWITAPSDMETPGPITTTGSIVTS